MAEIVIYNYPCSQGRGGSLFNIIYTLTFASDSSFEISFSFSCSSLSSRNEQSEDPLTLLKRNSKLLNQIHRFLAAPGLFERVRVTSVKFKTYRYMRYVLHSTQARTLLLLESSTNPGGLGASSTTPHPALPRPLLAALVVVYLKTRAS